MNTKILGLIGTAAALSVGLTGCDTPTPDQPDECNGTWSNGRCYEGVQLPSRDSLAKLGLDAPRLQREAPSTAIGRNALRVRST